MCELRTVTNQLSDFIGHLGETAKYLPECEGRTVSIRCSRKEVIGDSDSREIVVDTEPRLQIPERIIGAIGRRADFKNQILLVRVQYDAPVYRPKEESRHLKRRQCWCKSSYTDMS